MILGIGAVNTSPAAAGAPTFRILSINAQAQEKSKWCWVAVGATIAAYHGDSISQNSFCNLAKGTSGTCPNESGSGKYVRDAFDELGYVASGDFYTSSVSYAHLRSEILAGRPFYAGISWASGGGHALVIYGFVDDDFLYPDSIYYANPSKSATRYKWRTYSSFKSNSSYTWTRTLDNIRRK
jgi:hypothetical protein